MAMPVDNGFALELRGTIIGLLHEKLAEQERLATKLLGIRVGSQQVGHLVAKDGDAARLQSDHRCPRPNLGSQDTQDLLELGLRPVEHAEVVQRASAAEGSVGNRHLISRVFQNLDSRLRNVRMEVIAKRIQPKDDCGLPELPGASEGNRWRKVWRANLGMR